MGKERQIEMEKERQIEIEKKRQMEKKMRRAAASGDIDELHLILTDDPRLENTPMHDAVARGNTQFATELAILKPKFCRKLNSDGLSPMHVALQAGQFETVRALLAVDPELIRVKGSGGFTALHCVARKIGADEEKLLAQFLCLNSSSIEDLTCQGETALHVAVRNHNFKAFKVLFGWLQRAYLLDVLDMKDVHGNNVLHIAASTGQQEIVQLLVKGTFIFKRSSYVNVNASNFEGKTALDMFDEQMPCNQEVRRILRKAGAKKACQTTDLITLWDFLKKNLTLFERFSRYFGLKIRDESTRNMILTVATLVATATYQAALSPPGGYWQDTYPSPNNTVVMSASVEDAATPHKAGSMILTGSKLYLFMLLNSSAFLASIVTIWATAIGLYPDTLIVYISITSLAATYLACITSVYPAFQNHPISVLSILYIYVVLAVLIVPLLLYGTYWLVIRRVDATKRWVDYIRGSMAPKKEK